MDLLIFVVAVITGFLVGVVVNALADSMPRFRRPRAPLYPPDGETRPPELWSGTAAFLLGRREIPERTEAPTKLSWRLPIVEVGMAALFGFMVLMWPDEERMIVHMIYLGILALITVIDLEHYLILTPVIVPSTLLALVVAFVFPGPGRTTTDYLIGGAMGLGIFLAMYWGGGIFAGMVSAARGEELDEIAFGFGDVMLATLCGLMVGWQLFVFALMITVFAGAAGAVIYIGSRMLIKGDYEAFTPLPYGPYIVLGTVILMLWESEIKILLGG